GGNGGGTGAGCLRWGGVETTCDLDGQNCVSVAIYVPVDCSTGKQLANAFEECPECTEPADGGIGILPPKGSTEEVNEDILSALNSTLEQDPFFLVDIDCTQIQQWQTLAQHIPPQNVLDKLRQIDKNNTTLFGDFEVQFIQDAKGAVINMDYFPVIIDRLPNNPNTGQQFTPNGFLEYIRKNINNFINTELTEFIPNFQTGFNEQDIWLSSSPVGAIYSLNIPDGHDGSVVCSEYNINSSWIFTTLSMPWGFAQGLDGPHPVSGNREWGYSQNTDGSYTFFTRAVDRMESSLDVEIASYLTAGNPFSGADALWLSFQQKVQNFTNLNGGIGNIALPSINRPNWDEVKEVLLGNRPISDLGCD
ncbi:MAG: hypothetical protein U1C58_00755, partial [Flavobacteriaceae bacterium]|nr:hypothetical protein [Flavobacteriaceae bacterium]